MSDYMQVHRDVCLPKFKKLEDNQDKLQEDVSKIREKLFNGMSEALVSMKDDIKDMKMRDENRKRSRSLLVRDVLLTLVGGGGLVSMVLNHFLA